MSYLAAAKLAKSLEVLSMDVFVRGWNRPRSGTRLFLSCALTMRAFSADFLIVLFHQPSYVALMVVADWLFFHSYILQESPNKINGRRRIDNIVEEQVQRTSTDDKYKQENDIHN